MNTQVANCHAQPPVQNSQEPTSAHTILHMNRLRSILDGEQWESFERLNGDPRSYIYEKDKKKNHSKSHDSLDSSAPPGMQMYIGNGSLLGMPKAMITGHAQGLRVPPGIKSGTFKGSGQNGGQPPLTHRARSKYFFTVKI